MNNFSNGYMEQQGYNERINPVSKLQSIHSNEQYPNISQYPQYQQMPGEYNIQSQPSYIPNQNLININYFYIGRSDIGKKAAINEDHFQGFNHANVLFMCIADGMGSKKGLDIASIIVIDEVKKYIVNNLKDDNTENIEKVIQEAIYLANRIIYTYRRISEENYGNFYSTITITAIKSNKEYITFNIGNTRQYIFRQGIMNLITKDNTEGWLLLENGDLTEEEYKSHPDRTVLTKALGMPNVIPDIYKGNLELEDVVVLMSNGIYDLLTMNQISDIFFNTLNSDQACEYMIDGANELGGFDNSCVIMSYIDF